MEKIQYALWKNTDESHQQFSERLRSTVAPALLGNSPLALTIAVVDDAVSAASGYRMECTRPAPDALISLWLNSAISRGDYEAELDQHVARYWGYLVCESSPLPDTGSHSGGDRTPGMNQVVFLRKPHRLDRETWLNTWQGQHTAVAIETQSTFVYRQNVIVRSLSYGSAPYDAVVEECFPEQAIHSREAFYDAVDQPELFQQRQQQMMESCARFIDFDKIDCVPMSEYVFKR